MSKSPEMGNDMPNPVAKFEIHCKILKDKPTRGVESSYHHLFDVPIYTSDSFNLGRSKRCGRGMIPDKSVSGHHLSVHSVMYEDESGKRLPPLVYIRDYSSNGTYLKKLGENNTHRLEKTEEATLLDDGDVVILGDHTQAIFRIIAKEEIRIQLDAVQHAESEIFKDRYKITKQVLGAGGHGAVFVAHHFRTRRQLACKIIPIELNADRLGDTAPKEALGLLKQTMMYRELKILKNLSHPNIVGLCKVFWSLNNLYIFQDLFTGGDLFSYFCSRDQQLPPAEAGLITLQIAKGLEYLHSRGIVHRDLKPENVLLTAPVPTSRIVLADFGSSRFIPKTNRTRSQGGQRMFTMTGTIDYAAPEMGLKDQQHQNKAGYSKAIDMWALGVVSFLLLFGRHPGPSDERNDTDRNYESKTNGLEESMNEPNYHRIGERPRNFLQRLLIDEPRRMTATEAVEHSWFTNERNKASFKELYERAIRDWAPRHSSIKVLEFIDAGELRNEISHHFVTAHRPAVSKVEYEIPMCTSTDDIDALAEDQGLINEIQEYVNRAMSIHDTAEASIDQSEELTDPISLPLNQRLNQPLIQEIHQLHDQERAKSIIVEDLSRMNMEFDLNESIPRPDIFDLPDSDTDEIESSSEDRRRAPRTWPSQYTTRAIHRKRIRETSKVQTTNEPVFRILHEANGVTDGDIGDGFSDFEKENSMKGPNTSYHKRIKL